jgi:hypothetical protein
MLCRRTKHAPCRALIAGNTGIFRVSRAAAYGHLSAPLGQRAPLGQLSCVRLAPLYRISTPFPGSTHLAQRLL